MMERHEIRAALSRLFHPGQETTIDGVAVKRQAFRFVICGQHAYSVEDAAKLIETHREAV